MCPRCLETHKAGGVVVLFVLPQPNNFVVRRVRGRIMLVYEGGPRKCLHSTQVIMLLIVAIKTAQTHPCLIWAAY